MTKKNRNSSVGYEKAHPIHICIAAILIFPFIFLSYIGLPFYYVGSLLGDFFCFGEDKNEKEN